MDWRKLESEQDFRNLLEDSKASPEKLHAIFKHSTRCPVSSMVKFSLQSSWKKYNPEVPIYLLDLIKYRSISNLIAEELEVQHQSPQLILIKSAETIYHSSHGGIDSKAVTSYK